MTITQKIRKIGIQRYTFLKSAQNSASIDRSYIDIWATLNFCKIRAYGNFVESMQTLALLRNQWYCDFLIKYDPLQLFKPVEHAFHEKVSYVPCPSTTIRFWTLLAAVWNQSEIYLIVIYKERNVTLRLSLVQNPYFIGDYIFPSLTVQIFHQL